MRFQKCPFSSRQKRSKLFSSTLEFSCRFHLSTLKRSKTTGAWDCSCFNITTPSANLDRFSDLDWNRWHVTLFTSPFSKVSAFFGVFGRFSVENRQNRIKNYAFSKNVLVWMGFIYFLDGMERSFYSNP